MPGGRHTVVSAVLMGLHPKRRAKSVSTPAFIGVRISPDVKEQWALRQALPWASLGRKEKLEEYRAIVSQARSHAFHHVLPFDTTVEVDLSMLDVRAETIRLFVPFGKKEGRGVHVKDQKLADVLAEFTRAKERPVSSTFWDANLEVMKAAGKLAEEVLDTLVLIHDARRAGGRS